MSLTYEENGLILGEQSVDELTDIFSKKMIEIDKTEDDSPERTPLQRANYLASMNNYIESIVFYVQECLRSDGILFSVEHYATYYSTFAYILSHGKSFLTWADYMLAFLYKCEMRGVTHKDIAIQTFNFRYSINLEFFGSKKMNRHKIYRMLFSCESSLSGLESISDRLQAHFDSISDRI